MNTRIVRPVKFDEGFSFIRAFVRMGKRAYFFTESGINEAVRSGGSDLSCCDDPEPAAHPIHVLSCKNCNRALLCGARIHSWSQSVEPVLEAHFLEDGYDPLTATLMASQAHEEIRDWIRENLVTPKRVTV